MSARRWRFYATATGRSPVRGFLDSLSDEQASQVLAAMRVVALLGLMQARHLRGGVFQVRAMSGQHGYRILFANDGRRGPILLVLDPFEKKSQPTPSRNITLAERRLADWRRRAGPRAGY